MGHLGRHHARVYAQLADADLVGIYDVDPVRAATVAKELGVRSFDDEARLLDQAEAVSVVVPTSAHAQVAARALERGAHTLVEKPIASTMAEADQLVAAARRRGLVLQVGHIERFNQAVRALSDQCLEPKFIEAHRLAQFSPRGTDVAVVLDLMIHDIDLILWMVRSKPVTIDAVGVSVVSDNEDIANARLTFEDGCVANVTASRISPKRMRKMRLFQRNAYISLDLATGVAEVYRLTESGSALGPSPPLGDIEHGSRDQHVAYQELQPTPGDALELELRAFVQAAKSGTEPVVTGEEGRDALEVALQILNRMVTRKSNRG